MGNPYIISMYLELHFGLMIDYEIEYKILSIKIPFIHICICFDREARGYRIFNLRGK